MAVPTSAQSAITIAPSLRYEFGTPLLLHRDSGKVNQLGVDGDGVSQAHTLWLGAQLYYDSLLGNGWRWSLGAAIAPSVASFTSNPFTISIVDSTNASLIPTTRQFVAHGTSALAQISTYAGVPIGGKSRLMLGLWGTWRFAADVAITEELLSPDTITFADGQRTRSVVVLPEAITAPVHAGIDATIEFHWPIGYGLLVAPSFGLRCDATAIADGLGLRSFSSLIGISVAAASFPPGLPLPPLPPAPSPLSQIKAGVDLYAINGDQHQVAQIVPYRVHYRNILPILPVIFFEYGDARLPARYHQISPVAAATFGNATLAGLDSIQVYHHLLNIIGQRLQQRKNCTLRLIGKTVSGESAQLAQERAKKIQEYLISVWNIAQRRVVIEKETVGLQRQGTTDFSGVILQSEDSTLMAPIIWEWIVRRMAAPGIGIQQQIEADAGVSDWTLTIRQRDRQLLHRSLRADTLSTLDNKLLTLQNLREREATEPLVATLRVVDSLGGESITTDTLRVKVLVEQDTNQVMKMITTGTLFPAKYFPTLSDGNQQALHYVLADLLPGNRIVVGEREIEVGNQVSKAITTAVGKSLPTEQTSSKENEPLTEEWFFSKSIGLRVEP